MPILDLRADEIFLRGAVIADGQIVHGSSREFKENISEMKLKEAMTALKALAPVKFNYKATADDDLHLGFIAEDVPDLVATQDRKHLSTIDIVAVLTKVVQEQQTQIAKIQQEMYLLKNKIGE